MNALRRAPLPHMTPRPGDFRLKAPGQRGIHLEAAGPDCGTNSGLDSLAAGRPVAAIASTPAAAISAITPRHPACSAPTTLACSSISRIGTQSAVMIPRIMLGAADTMPSPTAVTPRLSESTT